MKELNHHGDCPNCKKSWDGGSVYTTYKETHPELSEEEINEQVKQFYSPPYRWSKLVGIEYTYSSPYHYDGISEWKCPHCSARFNRWTGVLLENNEAVKPFGEVVQIEGE